MVINIHLGDSQQAMESMKDNQYELSICDPPYGIINKKGKNLIENKSDKKQHKNKRDHEFDEVGTPDKKYFEELKRVSKEQIIWGGNYFFDYLGYCKAPIIWNKKNGASMYADGELAWTSRGLPKNLKIWSHQWCGAFKDSERGANYFHPTTKPIALYKWLLKNYAKPGDKIFDSHGGSMSHAIACIDMGFDIDIWELDEDYYSDAVKRIKRHLQQLDLTREPVEINYIQQRKD